MAETKFTKGPWHIGPDVLKNVFSATCIVADDIDDAIVCSLGHDVAGVEANAHLIAAAPEMYEALQQIRIHATVYNPESAIQKRVVRICDESIAKAEARNV